MMNKIPLVSKKIRKRLWFTITATLIFLAYSSVSTFLPELWAKLKFTSGDKAVLTIGLIIILSLSLSGLILAERLTPTLLDYLQKNQYLQIGDEKSTAEDSREEHLVDHYFSSLFLELQKELSQVNQHAKSLAEANKSLAVMAVRDGLSGLYNQYYIKERIQQEIYRTERYERPLSILMIDLDDFKRINDKHGHVSGDHIIKMFGRMLMDMIRPSDIPARYGGEEFLVVLPETNSENAVIVAERIRQKIAAYPFVVKPQGKERVHITLSVGICTFPDNGRTTENLIAFADLALYEAKKKGKNKTVVYEEKINNEHGKALHS